jgi:peptidoglycan/xylan/chitin deacetylase (PgdA/CDA1 family)
MPLLILAYHAISSTWRSQLAVSPDVLRRQLGFVRTRGFVGLTFAESERRRLNGTLPEKAVVVTFDDGYASTLDAKPILEEYGYPATIFVVSSFVESGELLRWPGIEGWSNAETRRELTPLGWAELEKVIEAGWEVGSHTVTHPLLTALSDDALAAELERSRNAIATRLGTCETIAYPYGLTDERVTAAVRATGYLAGCTLRFVHEDDERYSRPRIGLSYADTGFRLRAQLSGIGRRFRRSLPAKALRRLPRRRDQLREARWLSEGSQGPGEIGPS